MRRLPSALLPVALASGLVLAGCGRVAPASAAKTLVYGTTERVTDMDPASAYDFHTWEILQNICRGLVVYEPGTRNLSPGLAESYAANDKGDEFTFRLRRNLRFSDGTPFDAEAVKWSIDRVARLKGDVSWLVTDFVRQVDVVDRYTVRFSLKEPAAFFPALAATPPYFPVAPKVYPPDRLVHDVDELAGGSPAGLGPYRLVSFERGRELVLEPSPAWRGPQPGVKRIVIRYFADAAAMRAALEKGEVDLAFRSFSPSDIGELSKEPDIVTWRFDGPQIRTLSFETSTLVFSDKRLRQAVAALVDRQEIADQAFRGLSSALYSMIPAGVPWHVPAFKDAYGEKPDPVRAELLLAAAGYSAARPLRFDLWCAPDRYGDSERAMAEALKGQLERSGAIRVTVRTADWATFRDQWKSKQMAAWLLGWYPDYVDPDDYTSPFAGTAESAGMGINFASAAWDGWLAAERGSAQPDARRQIFETIQKAWTDEVPTIPLLQSRLYVFARPGVKDVKLGPTLALSYDTLRLAD